MTGAREITLRSTPIPGLVLLNLPVHGDQRGWFKENWHRSKMTALGLPDFGPVQNNISFNQVRGTTRGIHAEPWDKYISLASGRIFGAWVDLRKGPTFGTVFCAELTPGEAVFVPRGVGNAFQTLSDNTAYVYLVNDHWSPGGQADYTFLNLDDKQVAVPWPIPLEHAVVSAQDRKHPGLSEVAAVEPRRTLVLGANGQLGRALRREFDDDPAVQFADRTDFDISDRGSYAKVDWKKYGTIINAAAFTAVDAAETETGRVASWKINAAAMSLLAKTCLEHSMTLVHVSSDYVFDGSAAEHFEDEAPSPLGVYGQTKAAGDLAVAAVPRQYTIRSSWVVGEGNNFVRTMALLAARGVSPAVVDDQWGRLTFAADIAAAIRHLLETKAAFGTYNLSCDGAPRTWAGIAQDVYQLCGADPGIIRRVSTSDYAQPDSAPRPRNSVLNLSKIKAAGFAPSSYEQRLRKYLQDSQLL